VLLALNQQLLVHLCFMAPEAAEEATQLRELAEMVVEETVLQHLVLLKVEQQIVVVAVAECVAMMLQRLGVAVQVW
jgi:mannitol/fructose-specific phosphotransferase system IIA component (Ntr-type)